VRFAIRDTGIGIAPADQSKLFQPYSQIAAGVSVQKVFVMGPFSLVLGDSKHHMFAVS
jgi:hypothetical protein